MRLILIAAAVLLILAGPSLAERKRGGDAGIDDCLMGNNDNECDGEICYCCYEDGCWICGFDEDGNAYMDCVWDGAYSSASHPKPKPKLKWQGQVIDGGTLQMTPQPDPAPKPKLKVVPFKKSGTLAPVQ